MYTVPTAAAVQIHADLSEDHIYDEVSSYGEAPRVGLLGLQYPEVSQAAEVMSGAEFIAGLSRLKTQRAAFMEDRSRSTSPEGSLDSVSLK